MSIEQLQAVEKVMDAVKDRAAAPTPQVGEGLLDYWIRALRHEAWNEGYTAGNDFGYEYAQDTYDGPSEDPTPNPYAEA